MASPTFAAVTLGEATCNPCLGSRPGNRGMPRQGLEAPASKAAAENIEEAMLMGNLPPPHTASLTFAAEALGAATCNH